MQERSFGIDLKLSLSPDEVREAFPVESKILARKRLKELRRAYRIFYWLNIERHIGKFKPENREICRMFLELFHWDAIREFRRRIKHLEEIVHPKKPLKSIVELCEEYGIELRPVGRVLQGLCPFHEETRPSFTVYPEDNYFICFGCGEKGNARHFEKLIKQISQRGTGGTGGGRP